MFCARILIMDKFMNKYLYFILMPLAFYISYKFALHNDWIVSIMFQILGLHYLLMLWNNFVKNKEC